MSEDWEIGCSDDERYGMMLTQDNKWQPPPEIILSLYEKLDRNEPVELEWKCPGRREPTPDVTEEPEEEEKEDEVKLQIKDEYSDFEVEKGQLKLRPSGDVGPRGSAKKKTTSLDAILSNMERHRRMDMMEQDPPQ